jgi:hypothetical protein
MVSPRFQLPRDPALGVGQWCQADKQSESRRTPANGLAGTPQTPRPLHFRAVVPAEARPEQIPRNRRGEESAHLRRPHRWQISRSLNRLMRRPVTSARRSEGHDWPTRSCAAQGATPGAFFGVHHHRRATNAGEPPGQQHGQQRSRGTVRGSRTRSIVADSHGPNRFKLGITVGTVVARCQASSRATCSPRGVD